MEIITAPMDTKLLHSIVKKGDHTNFPIPGRTRAVIHHGMKMYKVIKDPISGFKYQVPKSKKSPKASVKHSPSKKASNK